MSGFLDTNIFVYASFTSFSEQSLAGRFLQSCKNGPHEWYVSWNVIYEFLSIATNAKIFKSAALSDTLAMENILLFCESPFVTILQETKNHGDFLNLARKSAEKLDGAVFHDAHIVALMKEHDVKKIYTCGRDFRLFDEIEVINPLRD
jgi:predicted nucleic acid-binding protein